MPEICPQAVTEEQYTDEHGNMVVKKVNNSQNYKDTFVKIEVFTFSRSLTLLTIIVIFFFTCFQKTKIKWNAKNFETQYIKMAQEADRTL